jgi:hypothetical protein
MCHQPFENWIIEGDSLPPEDRKRLKQHLEVCPQCLRLQGNLQAVHIKLATSRQIAPTEGFKQRWQTTLQHRLDEQHMKQVLQVRRFFLFIGAAAIVSLGLLIAIFLAGGVWIEKLVIAANSLQTIDQWTNGLRDVFFAVLQFIPPVLPLAAWILVSTVFFVLALIWVVSMWRITFQGVKSR